MEIGDWKFISGEAGHLSFPIPHGLQFTSRNWMEEIYLLYHAGQKRQQIRQGSNNFLSLVRNITELPHKIELDIPKNRMFFVFRFCNGLTGK